MFGVTNRLKNEIKNVMRAVKSRLNQMKLRPHLKLYDFQVKTSWGEKYQKWMAQTEQKIEELQTANNFL